MISIAYRIGRLFVLANITHAKSDEFPHRFSSSSSIFSNLYSALTCLSWFFVLFLWKLRLSGFVRRFLCPFLGHALPLLILRTFFCRSYCFFRSGSAPGLFRAYRGGCYSKMPFYRRIRLSGFVRFGGSLRRHPKMRVWLLRGRCPGMCVWLSRGRCRVSGSFSSAGSGSVRQSR